MVGYKQPFWRRVVGPEIGALGWLVGRKKETKHKRKIKQNPKSEFGDIDIDAQEEH